MVKIVVLLLSLTGTPVGIYSYASVDYPNMAACDQARPAVVADLSSRFLADKAPVKIGQSACIPQDEITTLERKAAK